MPLCKVFSQDPRITKESCFCDKESENYCLPKIGNFRKYKMCLNHVQTFPPGFLVLSFVLQITLTEISQIPVTSSQLKQ